MYTLNFCQAYFLISHLYFFYCCTSFTQTYFIFTVHLLKVRVKEVLTTVLFQKDIQLMRRRHPDARSSRPDRPGSADNADQNPVNDDREYANNERTPHNNRGRLNKTNIF